MTKEEIISGLLDNANDRRLLANNANSEGNFLHDALVMEEGAQLIQTLSIENAILKESVRPWWCRRRYVGKRILKG